MFYITSVALVLWALAYAALVFFAFVMATPEHYQGLVQQGRIKAEYVEYIERIPSWVIALTVCAAATRLAGGVLLLFRNGWAYPVYLASLFCVYIIVFRAFVIADVAAVIRPPQVVLEFTFLALSVFAPWYARYL